MFRTADTLDAHEVSNWIWKSLEAHEGAWRTPVLATTDPDLGVDARTIVLRGADASEQELVFYTARDSDKVRQFTRDSRCSLVVFDPEHMVQARLYGRAEPVSDRSWIDRAWQSLADRQQKVYALQRRIRGKENFAAYRIRIEAMHFLVIGEDGQNDAMEFRLVNENAASEAGGAWQGRVVEP